jgi:hypothetical protein
MFALLAVWTNVPGQVGIGVSQIPCGESCAEEAIRGCTVFTLVKRDQVFFGGNDDYVDADKYYWVDPGGPGKYGAIWIGKPDDVQQGVNEMGLAYDANGLPRMDTNPHPEREPVAGGYASFPIQILRENASVAEVIHWVQTHQWRSIMRDQMQFADAGGDAVIISPGQDGELIFTRKPSGDGFLVSTNFNVADPSHGEVGWRYATAKRALEDLLDRPGRLSEADAAGVLDAVHVQDPGGWTIVSLLADLPKREVTLYFFYQYERPLVLDVVEQISDPPPPGPLSQLFPEEVQQEAARRYQRIQRLPDQGRALGTAWLGLAATSLLGFALLSRGRHTPAAYWWPVIVILGPLGLLIWVLTASGRGATVGRSALAEAIGDATPTVLGFLIALTAVFSTAAAEPSEGTQITLLLGLPMLVGLLLYHGPLLAPVAGVSYLRLIWRRLPHVMVAVILGLAGIYAVAAPLVDRSLSVFQMIPLHISAIGIVWGAVVVGAIPGVFMLYIYHLWAEHRGFRAWSALAAGDTQFSTPSWRQLWWWIPLAIAALAGSLVVSQVLQGLLGS